MYNGLAGVEHPGWGFKASLLRPTLVLGVGIGGTGKSSFFKPLAKTIQDSVYVDKDLLTYSFLWKPHDGERKDMTRYIPKEHIHPDDEYYWKHVLRQGYHYLLMMARQMLVLGKHPILDGNYIKEIRWGYLETVLFPFLEVIDYELKIVLVHTSPEIIRKRLIARAADHDRIKLSSEEEWQKLLKEQPPVPPEIENYPHIKVDTTYPVTREQVLRVLDFLSK